ncbi:hypothetical protein MMC09_000397, partial [Bachmanniomyces sp. S44760]|nr:hypothetical protein [Bachmanniomyces sp. S44760]
TPQQPTHHPAARAKKATRIENSIKTQALALALDLELDRVKFKAKAKVKIKIKKQATEKSSLFSPIFYQDGISSKRYGVVRGLVCSRRRGGE